MRPIKIRLAYLRATMRCFEGRLKALGFTRVLYWPVKEVHGVGLGKLVEKEGFERLSVYPVTDHLIEAQLKADFPDCLDWQEENPLFLLTPKDHAGYRKACAHPFLQTNFYRHFRQLRGILLTANGAYAGGKLTYDSENRKAIPAEMLAKLPGAFPLHEAAIDKSIDYWLEARDYVEANWPDAPGDLKVIESLQTAKLASFFPLDHEGARGHLERFIEERLKDFGPYQDAFIPIPALKAGPSEEDLKKGTLFHACLSPMLNCGLLGPHEVVETAQKAYKEGKAPIQSVEGFLRQILGWREFIRFVYEQPEGWEMAQANQLGNTKALDSRWYSGSLGVQPVDDAIKFVIRHGYLHHILRLMVVANFMNLSRVHPHQVYRWFSETCLDAWDWVMVPNVYGMATYASPLLSTKPYISGSPYILRQSTGYPKGPWCDLWDGIFYRFLDANQETFWRNGRMLMMMKNLERKTTAQRKTLFGTADAFIATLKDHGDGEVLEIIEPEAKRRK